MRRRNDRLIGACVIGRPVASPFEQHAYLFRAHTVVGRDGNTRVALPLDVVLERLRRVGRL